MAYSSWSVVFGEQPSAAKWNILGTNDAAFNSYIQADGTAVKLLDDAGNEILRSTKTASAVNEITLTNAATGNSPKIAASGGDSNADLLIAGKGTGSPRPQGYYDGWTDPNESWSYSSYDSTNKTGVITVPTDATTKYQAGDRVKFTNNASVQYGIVTKIAATAMTVYFGTDYSLTNSAITLPFYSRMKGPFGFPGDPAKWTVTTTTAADRTTASTTLATLTDTIVVPIGAWQILFKAHLVLVANGANTRYGFATLSSDATTETNPKLTLASVSAESTGSITVGATSFCRDTVTVAAATTFTMMGKLSGAGPTNVTVSGTLVPAVIQAVCAYL